MGSRAQKQASLEAAAPCYSSTAFRGRFISIRRDEITLPNGNHKTWDIILHPGGSAIIPINEDGHLLLVEQWRRAVGKITLELPAGLIDKGELPVVTAQRELQEETGKKANQMTYLGEFYTSPGIFTEKVHLFIARDLEASQLHAEDSHEIDVRVVSLEQALKYIQDGTICDAKTALGILLMSQLCSS